MPLLRANLLFSHGTSGVNVWAGRGQWRPRNPPCGRLPAPSARAPLGSRIWAGRGLSPPAPQSIRGVRHSVHYHGLRSTPCFLWISTTKTRSEEQTSELQSLMRISYAVFCLKKQKQHTDTL